MSKSLSFIIVLLIIVSLLTAKDAASPASTPVYDDSYIEEIPPSAIPYLNNITDDVLLTAEEIATYNEHIKDKTSAIYDMTRTTMEKDEVLAIIDYYEMPSLPRYDNGVALTSKDVEEIKANCNKEALKEEVTLQKALVTERTNLKSFPTPKHFRLLKDSDNFDDLQETELLLNTPVLVIHQSKDAKWLLVQSEFYLGWVSKEDIVYVTDEQYAYFTNSNFAIITKSSIQIDGIQLDMSVKLPFLKTTADGYLVAVPSQDEEGNLISKEITVGRNTAHLGYLPYTKKNVYILAFNYIGTPYRWGGEDYGVDCSSYVANIYRTFGFAFPRNTSTQQDSVGKVISLKNKAPLTKLEMLKDNYPVLLYQSTHVMIYLGLQNEEPIVISASGNAKNMQVTTEILNTSNYLTKIDRLVIVGMDD